MTIGFGNTVIVPCLVTFSLVTGAVFAADLDGSLGKAWAAYRTHDFKTAEEIYLRILQETRGLHNDREQQVLERLAVLYCAMDLNVNEAVSRIGSDEWQVHHLRAALSSKLAPPSDRPADEKLLGDLSDKSVLQRLLEAGNAQLANPKLSGSILLKGTVSHSDQRNPVETIYRSGAKLEPAKLKALTPDNYWHRIPEWLAGEWTITKHTITSSFDYKTNSVKNLSLETPVKRQEFIGFQKDIHGDIWDFDGKTNVLETPDAVTFDLNRHVEVVSSDENRMVYRLDCTRTMVARADNKVRRTWQLEAITLALKDGENGMVTSQSQKGFDENGQPIYITTIVGKFRRVAPFTETNTFQGKNLRALFIEFMTSSGFRETLPK